MALMKVIEVLAQSEEGWEEAAEEAVRIASDTVRNIRSIYVSEMQATVENNRIHEFRINAKITFEIEGTEEAGGPSRPR